MVKTEQLQKHVAEATKNLAMRQKDVLEAENELRTTKRALSEHQVANMKTRK